MRTPWRIKWACQKGAVSRATGERQHEGFLHVTNSGSIGMAQQKHTALTDFRDHIIPALTKGTYHLSRGIEQLISWRHCCPVKQRAINCKRGQKKEYREHGAETARKESKFQLLKSLVNSIKLFAQVKRVKRIVSEWLKSINHQSLKKWKAKATRNIIQT